MLTNITPTHFLAKPVIGESDFCHCCY